MPIVYQLGLPVALLAIAVVADASTSFRRIAVRLADPDPGVCFDAIQALVESTDPQVSKLMESPSDLKVLQRKMEKSPVTRAAVEFVRLKRAGESVGARTSAPGRSSVVLISIDTLRPDHLGCYGYRRDVSPAIDAFAKSGTVFNDALSTSSWTLPAHMSMLTSLYPSFHKMEKGGRLGSVRLDESETTLAEVLKQAGWSTAGIVAHPYLSAEWGFDAGFELYRRYGTRAEAQTNRAMLWLEWHQFLVNRGLRDAPFFLFLHYLDPHETYDPPAPYATKYFPNYDGPLSPRDKLVTLFSNKPFARDADFRYALALYDGEINYTDEQLGRFFSKLAELGMRESTVIVLTSDHGEEFKDHGSMGHKSSLYREQVRVPLIFSQPSLIAAERKIDVPVSVLDIAPTILDLLDQPPLAKAQGISLAPYLRPNIETSKANPERTLFTELGPLGEKWEGSSLQKAIRSDRYKLINGFDRQTKKLFDAVEDPFEKNDLYQERKDSAEVRALETRLDEFVRAGLAHNAEFRAKNGIEIDATTRERLRALGYME